MCPAAIWEGGMESFGILLFTCLDAWYALLSGSSVCVSAKETRCLSALQVGPQMSLGQTIGQPVVLSTSYGAIAQLISQFL